MQKLDPEYPEPEGTHAQVLKHYNQTGVQACTTDASNTTLAGHHLFIMAGGRRLRYQQLTPDIASADEHGGHNMCIMWADSSIMMPASRSNSTRAANKVPSSPEHGWQAQSLSNGLLRASKFLVLLEGTQLKVCWAVPAEERCA